MDMGKSIIRKGLGSFMGVGRVWVGVAGWNNIIEYQKKMMKQYDFPRIFHNVVGEVIPPTLRNRDLPLRHKQECAPLQEMSSSCNTSDPPKRGALYVHSKKKKLVRRLKFNKTSSCFSAKNGLPQEDKLSQNGNSPMLRNFLKRKQLTIQKTDKLSSRIEKDEIFEKTAFLEDDVRSNQAQGMSSHRTANQRQGTSFDHHSPLEKEKNSNEAHRPYKQRVSQNNPIINPHNNPNEFTVRSKQKHRTFFKYDLISEERSNSKIEDCSRKKSKKKTVNFVINSEKENSQADHMRTDSPRRGTKVQRTFGQKSSKFNGKSKDQSRKNGSNFDLSECGSSNWSAKSVVSIKFTSTHNIKINSKKSLRSQQSIFQDNSRFMIKHADSASKYRTRTYIRFPHQQQISLKNYKSMTSLSEVSIDLKSDWSIKKKGMKRQQQPKTNKSLASSKKIVEKKGKMQSKVSIILKSSKQPYFFTDSQRTIQGLKSSTFQELVFKRNNTAFKAARTSTDPDIFTQLNNFHKFLHENSIQENEHELQRTITKPIVIDTSVGHRQILSSRLQVQQSLMLDMGLTLLKKMSVLRQKKL